MPAASLVIRTYKWGRWGWEMATPDDVAAVEAATDQDVIVNDRVVALYSVPAHLETIAYPAPTLARLGYGTCLWESARWALIGATDASG